MALEDAPPPSAPSSKNMLFAVVALVLAIIAWLLFSLNRPPAISDFYTCTVDAKDNMTQTDTFPVGSKKIVARGFLWHPKLGWKLRSKWIAVKVPGGPPRETILEHVDKVDATQKTVEVSLTNDRGFPAGEYSLELYLDPPTGGPSKDPAFVNDFRVKS